MHSQSAAALFPESSAAAVSVLHCIPKKPANAQSQPATRPFQQMSKGESAVDTQDTMQSVSGLGRAWGVQLGTILVIDSRLKLEIALKH